ncbi:MAG TPA: PTS sugar transporter subunit IIA [Phycisphaerae bacterium]|nr:PTS sugar transporter subunit IIA [Phycisphaerae bacterium]
MKLFAQAIEEGRIILDLHARDMPTICRAVVNKMAEKGAIPAELSEKIIAALLAREEQTSTAIGHAVAIPHAYIEGCTEPVIAFVRLAKPVNLGAPDGIPTHFLYFLLGPPGSAEQHLDALANIARLMSGDEFRYDAGRAKNADELRQALDRFIESTTRKPVSIDRPAPELAYSGRPFGGLITDIQRRLPHYVSDFRDGLHPKCIGSTLFLFFACLAPTITFGGVMAVQTGGNIGVVEMLTATAICGMTYALFAGQPLNILGGTGPLLVFISVLYRLCVDMKIPFLQTYAWVGLWSAGMILVLVATDACCLMRYFTRFTDEIFAALISVIFIYEAIKSLTNTFRDLDVHKHHDTALLTLLLAMGTFYIAMSLSRMRKSRYMRSWFREFVADFGPTIAMAAMTLVAIWLNEVDLAILAAPDEYGTTSGRPWLVSIFDAPMWVRWGAAIPALLATLLIFLDQNITARIVNSSDHKLHKGAGYHLDLTVIGLMVGVCSMFGLPWVVAATVRSINHVRSLATSEEVTKSNSESRDRILHVRETRVTGFSIHLLMGCSLLMLPTIKTVPMAVLYGLFLFMGIVSMTGNQFFERLRLWAMDPALYPTTHYIRRVPLWVIHKFTLLQLVCLVALWTVKASAWAIAFPILIAVLVPVRLLADRFFEAQHLLALDAEEEPEEEETHWAA